MTAVIGWLSVLELGRACYLDRWPGLGGGGAGFADRRRGGRPGSASWSPRAGS